MAKGVGRQEAARDLVHDRSALLTETPGRVEIPLRKGEKPTRTILKGYEGY